MLAVSVENMVFLLVKPPLSAILVSVEFISPEIVDIFPVVDVPVLEMGFSDFDEPTVVDVISSVADVLRTVDVTDRVVGIVLPVSTLVVVTGDVIDAVVAELVAEVVVKVDVSVDLNKMIKSIFLGQRNYEKIWDSHILCKTPIGLS